MPKVKIEKLVAGGQGLAKHDGCVYFVWDTVPGDEVEVVVTKKKKNYAEAQLKKIIVPAKARIEPLEEHYLSCSPWQILNWKDELYWKKSIAFDNFSRLAKIELSSDLQIMADKNNQVHYRNKIEYNLIYKESKLHLALFARKTNDLCVIDECCLVEADLNTVAQNILTWLNERLDAQNFQKLILRIDSRNKVLVGLYFNNTIHDFSCPLLCDELVGISFFQLDNRGDSKLISKVGESFLVEKINNVHLRYGIESFFQVNLPIFKLVVDDIAKFVDPADEILDLYSGVGSISLPLASKFKSGLLIEVNAEACKFAEQNILINKISNCQVELGRAENLMDSITKDKVLIVDPPRAGLDKNLVAQIIKIKPKRLIYLSCDMATQARDLGLLKEHYQIVFSRLYNFFPRTPHIEGLFILDKI